MKLFPFFQIGFSDQSGYGSGAASDDSTQYEGSGSRSGYETKSGFPNWADRCGEGCEGEPVQEVSRSLSSRCKASINWLDLRAQGQRYVLTSFVAGLWLRWKNVSQLLRAWILLLQKILGHPRSFTGENRTAVIHHRSCLLYVLFVRKSNVEEIWGRLLQPQEMLVVCCHRQAGKYLKFDYLLNIWAPTDVFS